MTSYDEWKLRSPDQKQPESLPAEYAFDGSDTPPCLECGERIRYNDAVRAWDDGIRHADCHNALPESFLEGET